MHTKVLEIILMPDNSDCNFEKALTKATMVHPTKMHAAILAIIMYKTTFKLLKKSTIDNSVIWVMVLIYFNPISASWKYAKVY